jgi:hypothetical protein
MKYSEKDKKKLIEAAIASWDIDISQATKRVNALIQAIDNGLFNGIPETGPEGFLQTMFVQIKTEQIMTTQID